MSTKITDVDFEESLLETLPKHIIEQIKVGRQMMKQRAIKTFTVEDMGILWGVQSPEEMIGKRVLVTMEVLPK